MDGCLRRPMYADETHTDEILAAIGSFAGFAAKFAPGSPLGGALFGLSLAIRVYILNDDVPIRGEPMRFGQLTRASANDSK